MLLVPLLVGAGGCATVRLTGADLFSARRTVLPRDFPLAGYRLEEFEVEVPGGGGAEGPVRLTAWHLTRERPRATVLHFGGQGFLMVQARGLLETLARAEVDVVLVDYRGYGASGGEPTVAALREDAHRVYAHVTGARGVAPGRLVVHGHSMGTFLAAEVAARHPVAGVVLENPATTAAGWTEAALPWLLRLLVRVEVEEDLARADNLAAVQALSAPLLLLAGGSDVVTRPSLARALAGASRAPDTRLVVLEEGEHNGLLDFPEALAAYRELVARAVR